METIEILQRIANGEDSKHQFKKNIKNNDSLAQEMVAFSNTHGGKIFIGVDDDGIITGLKPEDIKRLNAMISNVASQNVNPAINPITQTMNIRGKTILIINVYKGLNKPYQDKDGITWVKSGADKRKATAREEMQRLFQESGQIHADVIPAQGMTIADLDKPYFEKILQKRSIKSLEKQQISLEQLITNLRLGKNGELNISGALLFAEDPSIRLPSFIVKAAAFPGKTITTETFIDRRNITGKLSDVYQKTMGFLLDNTKQIQGEHGINGLGEPEIPKIVFQELVANALVHRDYFISAPIRIFVFSDRVEIISPGHLSNDLTIENIKAGIANIRNPVLASFANHILPYSGLGSGILRALENYPEDDIEFIDDRERKQFQCIIKRKQTS